jgi:SulP family sulfate permease
VAVPRPGNQGEFLSDHNNTAVAGEQPGLRTSAVQAVLGDLAGGFASALVVIPQSLALGLLAFAVLGPEWAAFGLIAGVLSSVIGGFASGLVPAARAQIMCPRTSATVVFAGILGALAAHPLLQTPQGPDVAQVLTLAFIAVFLSGLFQMAFGLLGFGRAIKFVPYPVLAGFMNGIALLMLTSQIGPALGVDIGRSPLDVLRDPSLMHPASLIVTVFVVATIMLAPRITSRLPVLVCGLIAGGVLHYLIAAVAPDSVGPVVGMLPAVEFAPHELIAMIHLAGRDEIGTWVAFLLPSALLLAAVISLDGLLAAVITDPLTRSRHNSRRLLQGQGVGSVLAAAFGALPPVLNTHTRAANYVAGGRTSLSALFHGLIMLGAVLVLQPLVARIPVAVLAGVIIYTAWMLCDRWTRDLLRRLGADGVDRREILLNLAVVAAVALSLLLVSMMVAFAVGIAAAVLLLLVKLSGSPVRRALDGTVRTSLKVRNPEARARLLPLARKIRIFELEGTIFFGTADCLQTDIENLPADTRYVILDFRHVTDIDASGARALETLGHTAARRDMRVLLSHVREDEAHGRYLHALGITAAVSQEFWFPDLDRALEWAEDQLLGRGRFEDGPELAPQDMALFSGLDAGELAMVTALLERHELAHGEAVFTEGDAGDRMYLIARGAVSIKVRLADASRARRLATFVPGVFFGEMGMIEGGRRSADAFAKGECVVLYSLTAENLACVVQQHPQTGVKLYRNLNRETAARLRVTSGALRALE